MVGPVRAHRARLARDTRTMIAIASPSPTYTHATNTAAGLGFGITASVGIGAGAAMLASRAMPTRIGIGAGVAGLGVAGTLLGVFGTPTTTRAVPYVLPALGAGAGAVAMMVPALRHNTGIGHAVGSIFMVPVGAGIGALAGYGAAMGMSLIGMGAFGIAGRHAQR